MTTKEKTCAQLVYSKREGRNEQIEKIMDILGDSESDREQIDEALAELGNIATHISSYKVIKIEMSGGGPADWIEVEVDNEGYVMRMSYHYADWNDHADIKIDSNSYLWDYAMQIVDTEQ